MTLLHVSDSVKMLRETFCAAQACIAKVAMEQTRWREHIQRLQRLIDACDVQRPLGPDGNHGDLHTETCGCEPVGALRTVLADREKELLNIQGPCSNTRCRLHKAHIGPCDETRK